VRGVCACVRFFIFQTSLPSARFGALSKESILPSAFCLALGEINFFLKKIMSWLCRVPWVSTRQNIHFAECQTLALVKIFFLFFATNFFFLDLYLYHEQHVQIWHNFIVVCYISSLYFVFLQFSGKCRFELQVH
jgi:hypothetical protein